MYSVIEVKQSIFEGNDKAADALRGKLKEQGVFLLNLMSSPGSGKTTTLMQTLPRLMERYRVGVMEADIDSDVDAQTISATGAKVIQLHTGGMCHLTADMTEQGLRELNVSDTDIVFLENIGNLVCPAEFDTGAVKNAMILSTPEGDDKPLKYPLMFSIVDVVLVNKIDVAEFFGFQMDVMIERVKKLNPKAEIIPISAKTGEGIDRWVAWLQEQTEAWKALT